MAQAEQASPLKNDEKISKFSFSVLLLFISLQEIKTAAAHPTYLNLHIIQKKVRSMVVP